MNEQTTQEQRHERAKAAAEACKRILAETKHNRAISAGCKEQILRAVKSRYCGTYKAKRTHTG